MQHRKLLLLFLAGLISSTSFAATPDNQQKTTPDSTSEILIKKIETLESQMSILLEKEQEDELQKLLNQANDLKTVAKKEESNIAKKFHTGVRQQSGLNPNISVSGDMFAGISSEQSKQMREPSETSYGTNGLYLRELEMSFAAPLDPFTRGKTFLSMTENSIAIEEAYMEWLNLPAGLNLKLGIFNPEFGILNRYHDHALPQFDRPRVLTNMFSNCNMGGTGVAANFMLPPFLGADALLLDLAMIHGGAGHSFTTKGQYNLLAVGNLTSYYDITSDTFFEWRFGVATGYNDPAEQYRSTVENIAFNLKWIPADRSKYRRLDWKTEILLGSIDSPAGLIQSKGFYSSLQNKLNAQWWLTSRVDYSELPWDDQQHEWAFTVGTDYWQSDFVFLRLQYQYSQRDFTDQFGWTGKLPDDHSLILQVNWAMGPHKHENY